MGIYMVCVHTSCMYGLRVLESHQPVDVIHDCFKMGCFWNVFVLALQTVHRVQHVSFLVSKSIGDLQWLQG